MTYTPEMLKHDLLPTHYYDTHLSGAFGKATGQGWHMWNGLCPFHGDKRPGSFVINKTTGAFKCFSCGTSGGDIIAFHMQRHALPFKEAFKQLQEVRHG